MDTKQRNSASSRAGTPKNSNNSGANAAGPGAAPQGGLTDQDVALSKAIGSRIRITTAYNNATIEGTLFTACPITNLLAINTSKPTSANAPADYELIPVSQVANFQILPADDSAPTTGFAAALPAISRVDVESLRAREEDAIRKLREHDSTRGKGVTKEAQEIFDHFKRTLPTRWNAQTIIVNESVLVNPPYTVESCRAPKGKEQAEAQIKRVLEGYYTKKQKEANSGGGGGGSNATTTSTANSGTNTPVGANSRTVVPALPRKGG